MSELSTKTRPSWVTLHALAHSFIELDKAVVQGVVAAQVQEGLEELSHFEGRKGGGEEIPLVQGKEQWLSFAGAAVKRYPESKVRETPVR